MNSTTFHEELQENILTLNKFFYQRLKSRPYWNFLKDGSPVLFDFGIRQNAEPRLIEKSLYVEDNENSERRDPDKTYKKLKGFRDIMEVREPTDEELRKYLKVVKDSMQMLQIESSDGSIKWCIGRAKGTKAYNDQMKQKAEDFANLHLGRRWLCLFLNFTCDPKLYKSRADAWKNFKKRNVNPVIEYLRKHLHAHYVGVMESHANGYPHCHYIIWLYASDFPELTKIKNGTPITYGKLYRKIRERIPNRVFKLIKAGGKGVVGYICKYITKGIEADIFKALTSDEKLSKTQRKEIIEFLALKAFKRRKLYLQQKPHFDKDQEEPLQDQVSVLSQSASESEPCTARQCRAYLIKNCTKSPLTFYKSVYSMSYGNFIDRYKVKPQNVKEIPEPVAKDFRNNSMKVHNSHNFYNDFVAFLQNWEESPLNKRFYWGEDRNNYDRMCDGYDFDNDEDWLECVTRIFDYYATQILINHNSYSDVLSGKENLTEEHKLWKLKLRSGKIVELEANENNEYENFYSYGEKKAEIEKEHKRIQALIAKNLYEIRQLAKQNN